MTNTLYDLLEVNQGASTEAIDANYKRLHEKFAAIAGSGDEDSINQVIALREAHATLSDPARRQRYDVRIKSRQREPAKESSGSFFKWAAIAVFIGCCGVGYAKYQSDQQKARLEAERVATAAREAELAAIREREEKEAQKQAEMQRRLDEANQQAARERDIAYGNQVYRNVQRAELQVTQERLREEQIRQREEQMRINEANRQLSREKAYLRQLEAENSRRYR